MFIQQAIRSTLGQARLRSALALFVLAISLVGPQPSSAATAATITVQSNGDGPANAAHCPGVNCSLRDAIEKANPGDTIDFGFSGLIGLTNGQLNINKSLTISTATIGDIDVDAQGNSRVFNIFGGATVNITNLGIIRGKLTAASESGGGMRVTGGATVNLVSVHFLSNQVTGSGASGGAISNDAVMTISDSSFFADSHAHVNGGAIANTGSLKLKGFVDRDGLRSIGFFNSSASFEGGAIYNAGTMSIEASVFDLSDGTNGAGALTNFHGTVFITDTLFTQSSGLQPGAIENYPASTMSIADSTITSGMATNSAGGIENQGVLTLIRSTVSANAASNGVGGGVANAGELLMVNDTLTGNSASTYGGGIYSDSTANTLLNNLTIVKNTADKLKSGTGNGGGIRVAGGTVDIKNSIIAANFDTATNGGPGAIQPDCSGALNSLGYNLLGIDSGCAGLTNGVKGDQVGTFGTALQPLLTGLRNNGGRTQTFALLPGSPAFNKGNPNPPGTGGDACAIHDQRNFPRGGAAGRCDIGAYEQVIFEYLPLIVR
jgi:predicted outer membrane repeat protein